MKLKALFCYLALNRLLTFVAFAFGVFFIFFGISNKQLGSDALFTKVFAFMVLAFMWAFIYLAVVKGILDHCKILWGMGGAYRVYAFGAISFLISAVYVLSHIAIQKPIPEHVGFMFMIICGFFAAGLMINLGPYIRAVWDSLPGKILIGSIGATVGWFSLFSANQMVAEVLALPTRDFELTVAGLALVQFLVWLAAIVAAASIIQAVAFLLYFLLAKMGLKIGVATPEKAVINAIALFLTCFLLASIPILLPLEAKESEHIVKWVAYHADFQEASQYPGLLAKQRVVLHLNGVVSTAEAVKCESVFRKECSIRIKTEQMY